MKRYSILLAALLFGCSSGADKDQSSQAVNPQIYPVAWNIGDAELPTISTLADLGETIVFFSNESVVVMTGGAVQGQSEIVGPFRGATAIPAADANGRWIVALDPKGRVCRVHMHDASIEDVSGRYGLEATEVREVAALGTTEGVAFLLADGIAIADGARVRHWTLGAATSFAASDKKVALVMNDGVSVFDVSASTVAKYPIAGASHAAFAADGRLFVAAGNKVYGDEGGRLVELRTMSSNVHSLVAAGKRVWFGAGADLGVVSEQGTILVLAGAASGATALIPSNSGDVWALGGPKVMRFAATGGNAGATEAWTEEIKPIFDSNCASCHMPGGLAGIDLSTYDQWNIQRASIMKRVIVEQNMPPRNSKALSDPDRETIRGWLTGQ